MARRAKKKRKLTKSGLPQRHPSGRLYEPGPKEREEAKAEKAEEVMSVALEARQRVFLVPETQAKLAEAGSVIGRLLLTREIGRHQFEAARKYEEVVALANAAILARGFPTPGDLNRSGGHDDSDGTEPGYVARCKAATDKANHCWRALREAGQLCRWAVDTIVIEDQPVPHAIGDLRLGLNALCRVLKIEIPGGTQKAA